MTDIRLPDGRSISTDTRQDPDGWRTCWWWCLPFDAAEHSRAADGMTAAFPTEQEALDAASAQAAATQAIKVLLDPQYSGGVRGCFAWDSYGRSDDGDVIVYMSEATSAFAGHHLRVGTASVPPSQRPEVLPVGPSRARLKGLKSWPP